MPSGTENGIMFSVSAKKVFDEMSDVVAKNEFIFEMQYSVVDNRSNFF